MSQREKVAVPPEVKALAAQAHRYLAVLSAIGGIDIVILLSLIWGERAAGLGLFIGIVFFIGVQDLGRVLTKQPRDIHLIKARNWAYLLHLALPIGPFVAWRLLKTLHHPQLVAFAINDNEEREILNLSSSDTLAVVQIKASFLTLRSIGLALFPFVLLAAITIPSMSNPNMRAVWLVIIVAAFILGLAYSFGSIVSILLLRRLTRLRLIAVRAIGLLLLPFFPFGTLTGGIVFLNLNTQRIEQICNLPQGTNIRRQAQSV